MSGVVRGRGRRHDGQRGRLLRLDDPEEEHDPSLITGGQVRLPMNIVTRRAVNEKIVRPQRRTAGEATSCDLVDPGVKTLPLAAEGKAATSDTPACNDRAQPCVDGPRVRQGVRETHDEAQRAPAQSNCQGHEEVHKEHARPAAAELR